VSGFKRKPMPDELTEALRGHAANLPSVTPTAQAQQPAGRGEEGASALPRPRAPRTVQINWNASEGLARLIAIEAAKAGSTRRFIARLMKQAGYDVPEADLNPADNRRRWS
jgi:hypothetical protein